MSEPVRDEPVELPAGRDLVIVCEGTCSPDLARWDALAGYDTPTPPCQAGLRIAHTRHRLVPAPAPDLLVWRERRREVYVCTVCGQIRIW